MSAIEELLSILRSNAPRGLFKQAPGPVHRYSQEDFGPGTCCPGCRRKLPEHPLPESCEYGCGLCGRPFPTISWGEILKVAAVLGVLVAIILLFCQ